MPDVTLCRSCNASIMFLRYGKSGNLASVNAEPDLKGNLAIVDGLIYVDTHDVFEPLPAGPRYMPHQSTCSAAAKLRNAK